MIGVLGFSAPWLLLGLIALPLLWWLLRALPPQPVLRRFPAVGLLIGLDDKTRQRETTPLWLMALRMALMTLVILAMAGPVLNPDRTAVPNAPLLIVLDGGWASAQGWDQRVAFAKQSLARADAAGQPAALLNLSKPKEVVFVPPSDLEAALAALVPEPYLPRFDRAPALPEGPFETLWIGGGLDWPGREALYDALSKRGPLRIAQFPEPVQAIGPLRVEDGALILRRLKSGPARDVVVHLNGTDPIGRPDQLDTAAFTSEDGDELRIEIEPERLARLTSVQLEGVAGLGGLALADAQLVEPEIGIVDIQRGGEQVELLDPQHYLKSAAAQLGRVVAAPLGELIAANPDAILIAEDVALSGPTREALQHWVMEGGTLIRFATAGLAIRASEEQVFLPVRLRSGGRNLGGALSWDVPRALMEFANNGPFAGLVLDETVSVNAQLLAEPGPGLAEATIASLEDGTPLITSASRGAGRVVFFHVGANAEWSSLPLSGLFPEMLSRLIRPDVLGTEADTLAGTLWHIERALDGFGRLVLPAQDALAQPGERLAEEPTGPELRPGLWRSGERLVTRNLLTEGETLDPATWPSSAQIETITGEEPLALKPFLLIAAAVVLLLDTLASALLMRGWAKQIALPILAVLLALPQQSEAQEDAAIEASREVTLAYVITGDSRLDQMAREGLEGLGHVLTTRTSVEPGPPRGVDPESDDLSFFPMIYWPVSTEQRVPSPEAYARLNSYLATGGLILFDTRDGDLGGATTSESRHIQLLAEPLDIPSLSPIPPDHVLTRAFYLLNEMPGRQSAGTLWVSAVDTSSPGISTNANDGVSPVIIGGGDWAGAWAAGADLRPLYPMGNTVAAERQREIAYRFGVNLVMYVLTGNYKSDQVHLPALLERLGQ